MLKKEDLIDKEIYYNEGYGNKYIFQYQKGDSTADIYNHILLTPVGFYGVGSFGNTEIEKGLRHATREEKLWLEECIKLKKLISRESIKIDQVINNYQII